MVLQLGAQIRKNLCSDERAVVRNYAQIHAVTPTWVCSYARLGAVTQSCAQLVAQLRPDGRAVIRS